MFLIRKIWYSLVFLPFLVLALVVNGNSRTLGPLFWSCIFVGFWMVFTLYFGQKMKLAQEFNSPYNTFFFISVTLFVGVVYCFWGFFTAIWGTNLFGTSPIYLNGWDLVFAFPYMVMGSVLLWACFRRYDWVYLGNKAVNARRFGFFTIICFLILEFGFIASFTASINNHTLMVPAVHETIDILLLSSMLLLILLLVYYSIVRRKPAIPAIVRQGTASSRRAPATPAPSDSRIYARASNGRDPNVRVVLPSGGSQRPFSHSSRESKVSYHVHEPTTTVPQRKVDAKQKGRTGNYDKLKPKAGVLTADDFKCIFCFQLPKIPDDAQRGIVLCPNCRYPAHADEFRNWTQNSNLCSRCGHAISSGFRQRPDIISAADYVEVIREFYRRAKK